MGIGTFVAGSDALTSWNFVSPLFGSVPTLEALVYLLVGLAGLYELYFGNQLYAARGARADDLSDEARSVRSETVFLVGRTRRSMRRLDAPGFDSVASAAAVPTAIASIGAPK